MPHQPASAALQRFRVIDLTQVRAGPTACRQLADWGADVIQVQMPEHMRGDDTLGGQDGSDYQYTHRNKRSITINLKEPEGIASLKRLIDTADVVVENFRPDVKYRLGIDYESLAATNPGLVYASISGFGQTGPLANRPGFDQIAQGMGGLMSVTGQPGEAPMRVGIPIADLCAGIFAAQGILVALLEREVSGRGQYLHTSLLESMIYMLDFQTSRYLIDGEVATQAGNFHPTSIPTGVYKARDGYMNIAVFGSKIWERFCHILGAPEWVAIGSLTALALSVLAAPVMQRLSGVDGATAIYSVALGASAEMSMQAQRAGADGAAVATAHALRIVLVTTSATALAWSLGHQVALAPGLSAAADLALPWLAGLMAAGGLVAWGLQRLHTPNPWLLGPLIVGALFATQWGAGRLPAPVLVAAQVVIGWSLGQNLTRDFFRRAPFWLVCSGAVTLGILALCMAVAGAMAWFSGMPLMAAFIAMAPGGMAEMGVIAKAFGLAAPTVTAFHLARILLTVFLTRRLARWMMDSGWVRAKSCSSD